MGAFFGRILSVLLGQKVRDICMMNLGYKKLIHGGAKQHCHAKDSLVHELQAYFAGPENEPALIRHSQALGFVTVNVRCPMASREFRHSNRRQGGYDDRRDREEARRCDVCV